MMVWTFIAFIWHELIRSISRSVSRGTTSLVISSICKLLKSFLLVISTFPLFGVRISVLLLIFWFTVPPVGGWFSSLLLNDWVGWSTPPWMPYSIGLTSPYRIWGNGILLLLLMEVWTGCSGIPPWREYDSPILLWLGLDNWPEWPGLHPDRNWIFLVTLVPCDISKIFRKLSLVLT